METHEFIQKMLAAGASVEVATKHHAREMGRIMRRQDADETRVTGVASLEAAVRLSLNSSVEAYAVRIGGDLITTFGVGPLHMAPKVFAVWALSSIHAPLYPNTFWRSSKIAVDYLRGKYTLMVNMVQGKSTSSLRWLERLGFKIGQPEPFGKRGELFCRVSLLTQKVVLEESCAR